MIRVLVAVVKNIRNVVVESKFRMKINIIVNEMENRNERIVSFGCDGINMILPWNPARES